MDVQLNINDIVRASLTPHGLAVAVAYSFAPSELVGNALCAPLWKFFEAFGQHVTKEQLFERNTLTLDAT